MFTPEELNLMQRLVDREAVDLSWVAKPGLELARSLQEKLRALAKGRERTLQLSDLEATWLLGHFDSMGHSCLEVDDVYSIEENAGNFIKVGGLDKLIAAAEDTGPQHLSDLEFADFKLTMCSLVLRNRLRGGEHEHQTTSPE